MNFRWRVTSPRRGCRGERDRAEDPGAGILQRPLARRERGPGGEHVVHQEADGTRSREASALRTTGHADAPEACTTASRPQTHLVPPLPSSLRQDGRRGRVDPGVHEAAGEGPGEPLDGLGAPCAAGRRGRRCGHDLDARRGALPRPVHLPDGVAHPGCDGPPRAVRSRLHGRREVVTPCVLPRHHDAPERSGVRREDPHRQRRGPVHPVQPRSIRLATCRGAVQDPGARRAERDVRRAAARALDRDEQARERASPPAHGGKVSGEVGGLGLLGAVAHGADRAALPVGAVAVGHAPVDGGAGRRTVHGLPTRRGASTSARERGQRDALDPLLPDGARPAAPEQRPVLGEHLDRPVAVARADRRRPRHR